MTSIREKGYHHWEGQFLEKQRTFWPITRTGLKLAFGRKHFKLFYTFSFIPAVVYAVIIYISERLEDFKSISQGAEKIFQINPNFFKSYLTLDILYFAILLLMSIGGAGLLADDFRHKAVQLYFARPLTKADYLLGKAGVVIFFVGTLTLIPAVLLYLLKLLFAGSFGFFLAYPGLILSIIACSLFLILFFTAFVLLASSLSNNRNYVISIIFGLYFFSEILRGIISVIFRSPLSALFSITANLKQVAAGFFQVKPPYDYPWYLSFLLVSLFCLLSYLVIKHKVRGVEVIK
ncbi:MAG: ABC transporter permease subunit [Acidobacteriota bacterium]|nr:ABC transporter permease subunit [Acidobacteriota bacterium]